MKLYMQVTKDEYEFPIHIATSLQELADMTGRTYKDISNRISRNTKGWIKIIVEDDECELF